MLLVPPPFDPDLAAALAAVGPSAPSGLSLEEITALHAGPDIAVPAFDLTQDGAFVTTDRTAPGPEGAPDVSLFVATPATPPQDGQPRPVIYHAHGGGMILGNNRAGVEVVLEWAKELDAIVVSVEYRLAPEHPYPAGVEDVYAGLLWTARHMAEFGGDPERIVVAGASAGGGLTAALALLSRDRGGPRAIGQVLMYPMLDDRNDTPSAYQMAGVGAWDRTANETAWTAVLGDARGGPDVPSYAAPARATDLAGLPPAFLDVGSAETFRDEVVDYASRIWQAGGVAELHVWPGGFHGFDSFAPDTPLSRAARAARITWLRRLLAP
ncbi:MULTISPECIES: alpha/beta hydrolase [unclassified Streptomyces]|uniref:alpha/beta hydrolase n=1 Tax=unclassified Streptomyces TaxID=2593676 RepID=UPI0013BE3134|nr:MULTISPECIES: alpha/beta hydrolase [unclassified Streptomyces]MCX5280676.1 alpha/beta hydrolase [Streptomyces sp. NBC_00198]NEB31258.1 alpha/beta hydrolase [Streptomyces sp. SID14446]